MGYDISYQPSLKPLTITHQHHPKAILEVTPLWQSVAKIPSIEKAINSGAYQVVIYVQNLNLHPSTSTILTVYVHICVCIPEPS